MRKQVCYGNPGTSKEKNEDGLWESGVIPGEWADTGPWVMFVVYVLKG